jgi:hypothetical protein
MLTSRVEERKREERNCAGERKTEKRKKKLANDLFFYFSFLSFRVSAFRLN